MAKKKPVIKSQPAVSDTSGGSLSDFKNKVVETAKVVASKQLLGPVSNVLPNKTVKNLAAEISGVNDVKRFAKDPSPATATMVGLSALQYAATPLKAIGAIRAARAASEARTASVIASDLVKTMKFAKNAEGISAGVLRGATSSVGVTGFRTAETAKNLNQVVSGRASMAARNVVEQYKKYSGAAAAAAVAGKTGMVAVRSDENKKVGPNGYTGVPQDKGNKSMPGYKSNYQSTPSPSKSSRESFGGTPITPSVPKKKNKGKSGGGKSSSTVE
jgi:hypothetical protein